MTQGNGNETEQTEQVLIPVIIEGSASKWNHLQRRYPILIFADKIGNPIYLILKWIGKMLFELCQRSLNSVCLFFCFILFLCLLYFQVPIWVKLLGAIAVFVVSSIGLSFLAYKEKMYEDSSVEKMTRDARLLLTLGVPDRGVKTDLSKVPQLQGADFNTKLLCDSIAHSIRLIAQDMQKSLTYVGYQEEEFNYVLTFIHKGGVKPDIVLSMAIQRGIGLTGNPALTVSAKNLYVTIAKKFIKPEMYAEGIHQPKP